MLGAKPRSKQAKADHCGWTRPNGPADQLGCGRHPPWNALSRRTARPGGAAWRKALRTCASARESSPSEPLHVSAALDVDLRQRAVDRPAGGRRGGVEERRHHELRAEPLVDGTRSRARFRCRVSQRDPRPSYRNCSRQRLCNPNYRGRSESNCSCAKWQKVGNVIETARWALEAREY